MLLHHGRPGGGGGSGGDRILSRPAVELMTSDQLTPEQKALGALLPGYFEAHGWGFGVTVDTRRDDLASAPVATAGTAAWAPPGAPTRARR